jgi:hypothetical protein
MTIATAITVPSQKLIEFIIYRRCSDTRYARDSPLRRIVKSTSVSLLTGRKLGCRANSDNEFITGSKLRGNQLDHRTDFRWTPIPVERCLRQAVTAGGHRRRPASSEKPARAAVAPSAPYGDDFARTSTAATIEAAAGQIKIHSPAGAANGVNDG